MSEQNQTRSHRPANGRPAWSVGVSGFLLMMGIGSMYGISALQLELPRLLGVPVALSIAPFGAASAGLAVGCGIGARVVSALGVRLAAVLGATLWGLSTVVAGAFLGMNAFAGVTIAFGIGGIGVGVAYLTIVATVGPSFPAQPLIGSAIGPLGFASGTAAFMLIAAVTGLEAQSLQASGETLRWIGIAITLIAVIAAVGMPSTRLGRGAPSPDVGSVRARRIFAIVLFVNAFPGMLVFAVAVQLVTSAGGTDALAAERILAALTIALFLGGLLAPALRSRFGNRATLVGLLIVRGVLLLTLTFVPGPIAVIVLVAVILFGHGAGFSLLPPVVRALDNPSGFIANYGRVLITWGLSGVAAAAAVALSLSWSGSVTGALVAAGLVALVGAGWAAVSLRRVGSV